MVSDKAIRQGLYKALNVAPVTGLLANGSASIHHQVAPAAAGTPPKATAYPMIVFNQQSSIAHHQFTGGDKGRYDEQVWMVKAVDQGASSSKAEDIIKAVDDILDTWMSKPVSVEGGEVMHLAAEGRQTYSEVVDGEQFRHHLVLYRLILQASS